MSTKHIGVKQIEAEFGPLTFGRLLKSHRLGEEFTQVEFAKKLGLSKQALNDLESGRKAPSIRRAIQIAKKIGILDALAIQLVLQDQVNREKIAVKVSVESMSKKAS
jgi:DNA-binding XRE family transcriptional regulator